MQFIFSNCKKEYLFSIIDMIPASYKSLDGYEANYVMFTHLKESGTTVFSMDALIACFFFFFFGI